MKPRLIMLYAARQETQTCFSLYMYGKTNMFQLTYLWQHKHVSACIHLTIKSCFNFYIIGNINMSQLVYLWQTYSCFGI